MATLTEILIKEDLITEENLNLALEKQKGTSKPLRKILVEMGFIKERELLKALAEQMHMPFYHDLGDDKILSNAVERVPIKLVTLYNFMPLKFEEDVLTIAISDPFDVWLTQGIKNELHCELRRVLSPNEEIKMAINKYYGVSADTVDRILDEKAVEEKRPSKDEVIEDVGGTAQDNSVIKLVNQILSEAISARATDIHLEPYRDSVRIRQRIDGVLYSVKIPEEMRYLYSAMVSRIKIISGLDVVERRLPQDGRVKIKVKEEETELRISVIPSSFGESVVIRILPTRFLMDFVSLGFSHEDLESFRKIIRKPHGIIFLTGPTGSGKTTTLYAALTEMNSEKVKIITLEDPTEYELRGISQIQINPKIGFSFAAALRSILRHDPDIIMVGEVRDSETAELAIRSSLTGHLVFSTLHTNDAASGAVRLLDMGIEPYLVASSVEAFISQRLVRLICPQCKEKVSPARALLDYNLGEFVYEGKGCEHCNFTGFFGRAVIYEILIINEDIKKLIIDRVSSDEIRKKGYSLGMKSLKESGLEKIRQGLTTVGEVMRVVELT